MGGAVSAGDNNDELIDNLMEANYITSKDIEEIFRAVDRGNYYLKEYRDTAYHDLAWKHDHLHISAPCIYSKVMSALDLKPGLSFLNIGSGTGYLSTMAGLVLGSSGINHGIELHEDVVDYARERVQEFIMKSQSFDRYVFCEPEFVVGNCLHLSPDVPGYDRIYCGAACPTEYESFMKNLLNINGLLVMPLNDQLQLVKRVDQAKWETKNILVVNFANLIVPSEDEKDKVTTLPIRNPQSLYSLCRICIRRVISEKYHSGSNRRYKKKSHQDSSGESETGRRRLTHRRMRMSSSNSDSDDAMSVDSSRRSQSLLHEDKSDSNISTDESDKQHMSTSKRSSILNVVTGTVTTVGDEKDGDSKSSHSSSFTNPQPSGAVSNQPGKVTDEKPSSSKSKKQKSKNKVGKDEKKDETDANGKLKRPKKGWAYIRHKLKNRKTEKSVFSKPAETSSDDNKSNTNNTTIEQSTSSADDNSTTNRQSAEEEGQSLSQVSISTRHDITSTTLRSFLVSVSMRMNSATPGNMSSRDRLLTYLTDRRRNNNRTPPDKNNEELDSEKSSSGEEIDLPPNHFHVAILDLPVPEAVKQFLLFYRVLIPN